MSRFLITAFVLSLLVLVPLPAEPPASPSLDDPRVSSTIAPFFSQYCLQCHNSKQKISDINLDLKAGGWDELSQKHRWEEVRNKIQSGEMPPKGLPRATQEVTNEVLEWIEQHLAAQEKDVKPDPGRVTARRLNRAEYNNTVHDLLAVDVSPADDFPADDTGYGFDNIGDVLTISPVLMDKYFAAARKIASMAVERRRTFKPTLIRHQMPRPGESGDIRDPSRVIALGGKHWRHTFEAPVFAEYEIDIRVNDRRKDDDCTVVEMFFTVDGKLVEHAEWQKGDKQPSGLKLWLDEGDHKMDLGFRTNEDPQVFLDDKGPMVFLDHVEIRGPHYPQPRMITESYRKVFVCGHAPGQHNESCARQILSPLLRRAYRRPHSPRELNSLLDLVKLAQSEGDSFESSIGVALQAMLVSPHFLFRIERDPNPSDPSKIHRVNPFELASRLSYFLWSSMPDDQLLDLAEAGKLEDPQVLQAQVKRMLDSPKAEALVENFAGQWLELRNLDRLKPDPDLFPEFDEELRAAMKRETELFFKEVMRNDRSILDFLDGRYTYLNERLAKHYGLEGIEGDEFRKVELEGKQRSGILTQASVLTVSSYPTRTSPVLRGVWVMENILGTPPPPPPPDVPELDTKTVGDSATLRQQLEAHRANPSCAVCHNKLDPLGFGLENYNAIGAWRTHEGKFPVDASGEMPNGKKFSSPSEMKTLLKQRGDEFAEALSEKMLTYALGRGLERYDKPVVKKLGENLKAENYRFSALVTDIVASMPFQMRRGEQSQRGEESKRGEE